MVTTAITRPAPWLVDLFHGAPPPLAALDAIHRLPDAPGLCAAPELVTAGAALTLGQPMEYVIPRRVVERFAVVKYKPLHVPDPVALVCMERYAERIIMALRRFQTLRQSTLTGPAWATAARNVMQEMPAALAEMYPQASREEAVFCAAWMFGTIERRRK